MIAIVSVPFALAPHVGAQLSMGREIPTRQEPHVGRTYFVVPLFTLSGLGLFDRPEIEIQYFPTTTEAIAWGEADIARRMEEQRAGIRALVLEGVRRREMR